MRYLFSILLPLFVSATVLGGPKGDIFVPFVSSPKQIDGDFSDWQLSTYTTIAQQPLFPDGQGVGEPTSASGDHLVWDINRIGPFNGTDPDLYEPDGASDYGSSVYFAWDNSFLYMLGVFIDDEPFGNLGEDGFTNFLNDGFEIFIDAKNDGGLPAEFSFPSFDEDFPDDFQFTMGLNNFFAQNDDELGVEVHMERGGNPDIVKQGYLDIRDAADLGPLGGRDVAAKLYDDLRAAGATNPEIAANPDEAYSGYAVELAIPFGITDGFSPAENEKMGFDLFWRDVDVLNDDDEKEFHEPDVKPGFGSGGTILWADWTQATEVTGTGEDGNLFNADNWGELIFTSGGDSCDFDGDGSFGLGDIDLISAEIQAGTNGAGFDVNGDGEVNSSDLTAFVTGTEKLNSWIGDANVDGEFNSSDLVSVFQAGLFETQQPATWSAGDWNGDGFFNSSDFVSAFQGGGFELGPRVATATVPEPTCIVLLATGIFGLMLCRRF